MNRSEAQELPPAIQAFRQLWASATDRERAAIVRAVDNRLKLDFDLLAARVVVLSDLVNELLLQWERGLSGQSLSRESLARINKVRMRMEKT